MLLKLSYSSTVRIKQQCNLWVFWLNKGLEPRDTRSAPFHLCLLRRFSVHFSLLRHLQSIQSSSHVPLLLLLPHLIADVVCGKDKIISRRHQLKAAVALHDAGEVGKPPTPDVYVFVDLMAADTKTDQRGHHKHIESSARSLRVCEMKGPERAPCGGRRGRPNDNAWISAMHPLHRVDSNRYGRTQEHIQLRLARDYFRHGCVSLF